MKKDIFTSIFWLIFAVYFSIESYRLGLLEGKAVGPGYFPFGCSLFCGIISLYILVKAIRKISSKQTLIIAREPLHWQNLASVMVAMLVYILFFNKIGFVLCTFLIVVFFTHVVAKQPWFGSLIIAFVTTLASVVIFKMLLEVPLPRGIFIF